MRRQVYEAVADRDDYLCRVCGTKAVDVHHIVFRSHGGADVPENLICLCRTHHELAHKYEPEWREKLIQMNESIYGKIDVSQLKKV